MSVLRERVCFCHVGIWSGERRALGEMAAHVGETREKGHWRPVV